jgi:hypothetical protein
MQQKRPRPASSVEVIDGREDVPGEEERVLLSGDDAERTLSDSRVPMEVDVVVAESTVRRYPNLPKVGAFERAGLKLSEFRLLRDEASRRAALPSAKALGNATAWPIKRIRSLAVHCKLEPAKGLLRGAVLALLEIFREEPRELDLNETPPPLSVDLDAQQEEQLEDAKGETARLRALELSELLADVEGEEREAEAAEAQAARDRIGEEEALAAVHASQVQELQERLSAMRRAKAQRLLRPAPAPTPTPLRPLAPSYPLLTASRLARMDKRLPRLPEELEGPQPAPPSPDARRPAREDAGSGLVVRIPLVFFFPLVD